jgi:site-specific recombinase XerD
LGCAVTPPTGCRTRAGGAATAARNAAFADLLFDSGLRLREAGCLLTIEVPHALAGQSYYEGTVAQSIAKKRERMFYVGADALAGVTTYIAVARRAAIRRARRDGVSEREITLREQTNDLTRRLNEVREERDNYRATTEVFARAMNVLTRENADLRKRLDKARSSNVTPIRPESASSG